MSFCIVKQLRQTSLRCRHIRFDSTLRCMTQELDLQPSFTNWSKVIREAEKIVGYPTSFMNLRWLLSDEFANVAMHLRKLVGSDHPILSTAKSVLYNQHNSQQPWGLLILLLSKSINQESNNSLSLGENEVYQRQRILAELTEMIRTGNLIHKGLINISPTKRSKADTETFGNKIGILIGDYLLVTANGMLAKLRNQDLSYIISSALRDLSEGEFFGDRDVQSLPVPGKPVKTEDERYVISSNTTPLVIDGVLGSARREWTVRAIYGGASLLGRGCQGAVLLADQSQSCQDTSYLFGCHVGLAWQAATDLQKFSNNSKDISLVSAPVLFAISSDPELYKFINKYSKDISEINVQELRRRVLKTDAIEKTRLLYEDHANIASQLISSLGSNKCVDALKKIVRTL